MNTFMYTGASIPLPWDIVICILLGFFFGYSLMKKFKPNYAIAITFLMGALLGYEMLNILPVAETSVQTLLSTTNPSLQILVNSGQITTLAELVQYTSFSVWILVFFDGLAALMGSFIAKYVKRYTTKT